MNLRLMAIAALVFAVRPPAQPQMAVSARAGLIHHAEGEIYIDGETFQPKAAAFTQLAAGQSLRTADGRAELLMTPQGFARGGRRTEVRLLSADIADAGLLLVGGSVIVDFLRSSSKKERITLAYGGAAMELASKGLYRFDAVAGRPPRLRVYKGRAVVRAGGESRTVAKTQALEIDGGPLARPRRFDPDFKDELDKWNAQRARAAARMARVGAKRKRPPTVFGPGMRGRGRGASSRSGGGGLGGGRLGGGSGRRTSGAPPR